MISTIINNVQITCKIENLVMYQIKLAKPPKGGTRQSAEKRRFPNTSSDLSSTAAYVKAYLRLNSLRICDPELASDHWTLNTAPTTWPEGPDCIATVEDD